MSDAWSMFCAMWFDIAQCHEVTTDIHNTIWRALLDPKPVSRP